MLSLIKVDVAQIDGHENWLWDFLKIILIPEDAPPAW
jgi:hypothetical protein